MSEHTPGPWAYGHSGRDALWVGPGHDVARVATVEWDTDNARENARANARLIAAAPELLAALMGSRHYWTAATPIAVRNLVRTAIAKATGESA
jgi:hypothetical protein